VRSRGVAERPVLTTDTDIKLQRPDAPQSGPEKGPGSHFQTSIEPSFVTDFSDFPE